MSKPKNGEKVSLIDTLEMSYMEEGTGFVIYKTTVARKFHERGECVVRSHRIYRLIGMIHIKSLEYGLHKAKFSKTGISESPIRQHAHERREKLEIF